VAATAERLEVDSILLSINDNLDRWRRLDAVELFLPELNLLLYIWWDQFLNFRLVSTADADLFCKALCLGPSSTCAGVVEVLTSHCRHVLHLTLLHGYLALSCCHVGMRLEELDNLTRRDSSLDRVLQV
jgi:hypothetical protein